MEMSYGGTLVMPKSYAVMDQKEMCYVEGGLHLGKHWYNDVDYLARIVDAFIIVLGFGVACYSSPKAMNVLMKVLNGDKSKKLALKLQSYLGISMASCLGTVANIAMATFGTSPGEILTETLDRVDGRNVGYVF